MTRSRRPLATLLFVCLAAALAGCGSTVQLKGAVTTQGAGLDGPSSQQDLGTQGAAAAAGSSEAGTGAAGGVGSRAGVGAASGSGSESVPRAAGGGPVISGAHTRLKVGVLAVDWNGLASQFGAAFPTNYFDVYRNVFGYLNKHGGIAGHPIQAVYHVSNGAAANRSDEDQTSCTFFTQDNSVQVVLTEGVYEPDFAACIKKKGVVQIDDGQYGLTQSDLTRLGNVIVPEGVTLEREAAIEFAGMVARGVLTKRSVVGVIVGGCADEVAAYDASVVPLAKKYGFTLVESQLACYGGASGLAEATSQIQGTVLKFRSSGVDQVFAYTASEGFVLTVFMNQASSQSYHPGYLLTSNGFPYANTASEGTASYPDDARPYLKGMGWQPYYDADGKPSATGGELAAQRTCATMDPTYGGAKTAAPPGDINEMQLFFSTCDDILMLAKVLAANGMRTSVDALRSGFAHLSFVAAGTYRGAIQVTGGHADGAVLAAPFSWKKACSCVTVDGPPMAVPD